MTDSLGYQARLEMSHRGANAGGGIAASANSEQACERLLTDQFRCLPEMASFEVPGNLPRDSSFFRFGPNAICYGTCSPAVLAESAGSPLPDAGEHVVTDGTRVHLPFDPAQVVDNLRGERYTSGTQGINTLPANGAIRSLYYFLRPALSVAARKHFQKFYFRNWRKIEFPRWPVDRTVEEISERLLMLAMKARNIRRTPMIWYWPEGAPTCTIMTHDVETSAGLEFCPQLMDLNDSFGIKSSFQIVPEKRYNVSPAALERIRARGFEINVHDLNHDGRLMCDHAEFLRRAERINMYGKQFGALGFRSAIMYRNSAWYGALDFSYDMSIPSVAHLDPQQGGCCTTLPFFIGKILELPLTTTQDYSLFNILDDYSIRLWKEQIARIREGHGLISFIIHPDYNISPVARRVYADLLRYLSELRSQGQTWIALPRDVAAWWRLRSRMHLVKDGDSWRIEGEGKERARVAYAELAEDKLIYEF